MTIITNTVKHNAFRYRYKDLRSEALEKKIRDYESKINILRELLGERKPRC